MHAIAQLHGSCSMPPATAPTGRADRRSAVRIRTVCRIAVITSRTDSGLCRLHNISDTGILVETCLELRLGEEVEIGIADDRRLVGRVIRQADGKVGLRFVRSVDCLRLLRDLAADHWGKRTRSPRLLTHRSTTVRSERGEFPSTILAVSQQAMTLRHAGEIEDGMKVEVRMPGGALLKGIASLRGANDAEVELSRTLSFESLTSVKRCLG